MKFSVIAIIISTIGISLLFLIPYVLLRKINSYIENKPWYNQVIVGICSIFLLLSAGSTLWFYAKIDHKPSNTPIITDNNNSTNGITDFYYLASKGKLENNPVAVQKCNTTIAFKGSELTISEQLQKSINFIFIKMTDKTSSEIKIKGYVERSIFNGIDITDRLAIPELMIEENTLVFKDKNPTAQRPPTIEAVSFDKDFTLTQFIKHETPETTWGFPISGSNVIYLEIPSNIKVSNLEGFVQFLK